MTPLKKEIKIMDMKIRHYRDMQSLLVILCLVITVFSVLPNIKQADYSDGVCNEPNENPINMPKDCGYKINLKYIFCLPLFNCGNWKELWFYQSWISVIIFITIYLFIKSKRKNDTNTNK